MQTSFTRQQLENPRTAEIDKILRRCVHCGFCTATCPTYVLLGDERDSPRGRIYLMKEMFEHDRPASPEVQTHVDRCLSCLSCMTTCPSGVDYMHLVDHTRAHIEETGSRGFRERLARALLAAILPYPDRFRLALRAARFAQPFAGLLRRLGFKELVAMLELAPAGLLRGADFTGPGTAATKTERRRRVILLAGCAQQVLRPEINDATIRLLARRGVDVEVAPGAGCCGALVHHMGREAEAIAFAKRNIDAWTKLMDKGDRIDAIIINASGCGTTVKDYAHMLAREPGYAERAAKLSAMARDVTEFLGSYDMGPPVRWSTSRASCCGPPASRWWRCRRGICAAARPAPTTSCSPTLPRICATARSPTSKACAPTWWRPATSAASPSWRAAWTSPSPTPSSCWTGPTAAPCPAGWKRSPATCRTCPRPSRSSP